MTEGTAPRSWPRRWLDRLEVNRAVFYAVAIRGWQLVAGPVTMLLIATFFQSDVQGYFYTFWSLIALQTIAEMGFQIVIVSAASHEWAKLTLNEDGQIEGDETSRSRLISLGQHVLKWYAAASLLFVIGVGVGGSFLLAEHEGPVVDWQGPWLSVVLLTGLTLWLSPFNSLLEGCNQVQAIYRFRFIQAVAGNIAVWISIPFGAELWTVAAACLVRFLCELWLIFGTYGRFFRPFFRANFGPQMDWFQEIWPMQWQLALRAITFYLITQALTPLMFHYHGAVIAGQMGMTWTVLTALQMAAAAWIQTRTPELGMLVAERKYQELDRKYNRLTIISVSVLALGCGLFCLGDLLLYAFESPYASRLLPPLPTTLFCIVVTLSQIADCQWRYIHAHRKTAFTTLAIVSSVVQAVLIWLLGSQFGPTGAASARLLMAVGFSLPVWTWAWYYCRREWHT